jgi:fumarylpyruvate hydrolase
MTAASYLWAPPPVHCLPVRGNTARFPINRIFCVGRNYHAHAVEMGKPVDKSRGAAFYFTKSPQHLTDSGATVAYPPRTSNYHFEMELVLAIGKAGFPCELRPTPTNWSTATPAAWT